MSKEIRLLKPNEIEVRVQSVVKSGDAYILLLYKDARVDMKILDETYGVNNWQRTHQLIGDRLYCTIEIWDSEKNCWVAKQDVGTESYTEKEKGQASDSFKRAGFNIGIGRELYTSPFIFVTDSTNLQGNKLQSKVKFSVVEISYNDDREISKLIIEDNQGNVRWEWKYGDSFGETTLRNGNQTSKSSYKNNTLENNKLSEKQLQTLKGIAEKDKQKLVILFKSAGIKMKALEELTKQEATILIGKLYNK